MVRCTMRGPRPGFGVTSPQLTDKKPEMTGATWDCYGNFLEFVTFHR